MALSIQLCRQSLRVRSAHADIQEMRHQDFLPMREKEKNSEKWKTLEEKLLVVFDVNQGGTKSLLLPYTIQFPYVQILEFE